MKLGRLMIAKKLPRTFAGLIAALMVFGAGLVPGTALAFSPPSAATFNYGMTAYGYQLISIDTVFCDGTFQHAQFLFGVITYTETQTYTC
ncbi:hypothetical protein [Sphingomonas sp.]|uniref:hypothetical protein n=1 Tax=Sphingomonas sp. TaxID=28214 RepID=UPI003D6D7B57